MPHRICVKYTIADARGAVKKNYFNSLGLKGKVSAVTVVDCYTIDVPLKPKQIETVCAMLANPLIEKAATELLAPKNFNYAVEIGFLPGVTDNVAATAKESIADGLKIKFKPGQNVYSSQVFFVSGKISKSDIAKIATSLYNPLIQRTAVKTFGQFQKTSLPVVAPKVKLLGSQKVLSVNLNLADAELAAIGKQGILEPATNKRRGPLSLDLDYLKTIRNYFNKLKRLPTDIELESLAQTWSEHCKHTIFADPLDGIKDGLFKHYIKRATEKVRQQKGKDDFCVSVFTDNSGAIRFDQKFLVTHKVETHNTPSALDPFGGSITGIVGVNRDSLGFGLGAKPIINTYGFCLADPNDQTELYRFDPKQRQSSEALPARRSFSEGGAKDGKMLSARRIMEGVVAGINAGGNQSGIPTNSGFIYFNLRYRGKPLVFAGTVGLIPKTSGNRPSYKKQARPGDLIVMVGGRVGQDGIHGATFSSEGLDSHSPATAVQIGDPITQKKMSDALAKEARDLGLYTSITDNGAGGLSSSVGEMAKESGGCLMELDKVPLKYPGLQPWQIWISESQERMTLAVPKAKWQKFASLMKQGGVEATVIGEFTNSGKCVVKYRGKIVMDLAMDFLHDGRPIKHLKSKAPTPSGVIPPAGSGQALRSASDQGSLNMEVKDSSATLRMTPKNESQKNPIFNFKLLILNFLSSLNITSHEFITKQYDHEVQAGSVLKPLQGSGRVDAEATVTRPVLSSQKGLVLSYGLNPELSEINPYNMAACAIDSAIRAAVAAGANIDQLALLDNFCWCSSTEPERLWQLKEACKACFDYAVGFGTPFISGKDSMFNDFKGFSQKSEAVKISIPPTLLISAIGVVPDASKTVSLDAKTPGDFIYILGKTNNELGGSEYEQIFKGSVPIYEQSSEADKPASPASSPRSAVEAGQGGPAPYSQTPSVNAQKNLALYRAFYQAVQKDLVASAIPVSRGGLAIALCKTAIGGGLGVKVTIDQMPGNAQSESQKLFSESQGRLLVTVSPAFEIKFEQIMKGLPFTKIGKIVKNTIEISEAGKTIVNLQTSKAEKAYKKTLEDY